MPGGDRDEAKKLILVVVVVFVGFWMFTDPTGSPRPHVRGAAQVWDLSTQLFSAVIGFIGALT